MERGRRLLGLDTYWLTPAARNIAMRIEAWLGKRFSFPNSIAPNDIMNFLGREPIQSHFGQLCYISYLLLLLAPAETLAARRAYRNGHLADFPRRLTGPL